MISALAMIPEQRTPPNHSICNHPKLSTGLEYSLKVCIRDCEKSYVPSTANKNVDEDLPKPVLCKSCNIPSVSESLLMPCDKESLVDKLISSSQKKINRPSPIQMHKPAEVFRTDLISAMKIPDTAPLPCEDYLILQDQWRIEWEKGVQVPVNFKAIPSTNVWKLKKEKYKDFKIPRKFIRSTPKNGDKSTIDLSLLADLTCRYDLDEVDVNWLQELNCQRKLMGLRALEEYTMEIIMETLESQCYNNMQADLQTKDGLGIEFDENVVCEVCRQPDSDEGNEVVFCDGCNLGVHQACYGILKVPEGSWLCKPCALGLRNTATCIFCGRRGGAMKSTRTGNSWAHVICALWIPEVSFADPIRMEPVAKVSHVPASRWALLCSLCKERVGACIQCSVKQCVTAYHVTCAVERKLDMCTDCDDINKSDSDAVVFKSYCKKHSKNRKEKLVDSPRTSRNKEKERRNRIMESNKDFQTYVDPTVVESILNLPSEVVDRVLTYWKLKRTANFNAPLIVTKGQEQSSTSDAAETNLKRRLRFFTHIRQDLERVRNLCYMVCRREKLKLACTKNMENVFLSQMKMLEYRMKQGYYLHSPRLKSMMQKIGKPEVCAVAQQETSTLARSKYWSKTAIPEQKLPRPFKKSSPKTSKNETQSKKLTNITEENTKSSETSAKQNRRLSFGNKSNVDDQVSNKRRDLLKKRRRRSTTNTRLSRAPSRFFLRKRSLGSSETDFETENLKPSVELSPNSKRVCLSRGQLFEANFVLSDENRAELPKLTPNVLSDSSTQNNSFETESRQSDTPDVKREKAVKKSPLKACRNVSLLKRQLRRKSSTSYFCAKQYQCYVLY